MYDWLGGWLSIDVFLYGWLISNNSKENGSFWMDIKEHVDTFPTSL